MVVFLSGQLTGHLNLFVKELTVRAGALTRIPYWHFFLMVALAGAVARFAFFPTVGYDDNALHLRMWTQLAYRHIYSFDVVSQVWEVAPFAVDLLHSIVSLVAGADARGALNLAFLALIFRQLWVVVTHLALRESDRLLMVLLFVSTPLVGNLLVTLQTELFLALLAVSGVRLVLKPYKGWLGSVSVPLMAVVALCCATKLPGVVLGVLLLCVGVLRVWSTGKMVRPQAVPGNRVVLSLFIAVLVFVAFHSYLTAWYLTGNPFFPLYNGIFKSPYFYLRNFADPTWLKGFSLKSYWNLFFKTSEHFESKNFVAGFHYLFLFPLSLFVMLQRVPRLKSVLLFIPLTGFAVVMFFNTQYWRYIFPVFPLATAVIGVLLMRGPSQGTPRQLLITRGTIGVCIALNFYFYPGVSWFFTVAPQRGYTESGRKAITEQFAPAKAITAYLNERVSGERVLYHAENPFGATLRGDPIYTIWYSHARLARIEAVRREEDVVSFLNDEKIGFVVWNSRDSAVPGGAGWLLREYLSRVGFPEYQVGSYVLYRVSGHDLLYQEVFRLEDHLKKQGRTPHLRSGTSGMLADQRPRILASIPTKGATSARYRVTFECKDPSGSFIAQVNWNAGSVYYHPVPCGSGKVSFSESVPVPFGATEGEIYATVRDTAEAFVSKMTLETN